jgi:hypothetical protein
MHAIVNHPGQGAGARFGRNVVAGTEWSRGDERDHRATIVMDLLKIETRCCPVSSALIRAAHSRLAASDVRVSSTARST